MKKAKILVSTALALCMGAAAVIPAFAVNAPFTYTKIGDYNADNKVNITDVTTLQLQLSGGDVVTGAALEHTDFDGDGIFDVNDISQMQKMVVGAEYNCYQQMDNSYKNIPKRHTQYHYGCFEGVSIDSEKIYDINDCVENEDEVKANYPTRIYDLITSEEQFCDVFKGTSPEYDDEFFKDNALFVIAVTLDFYDDTSINGFSVNENKLVVYNYHLDDFIDTGKTAYINKFYRLNKADVEDINEIVFYTTYMAQ